MTSVFSWQNSISLCPVSFCIPRPSLPVTPGASLVARMVKNPPAVWQTWVRCQKTEVERFYEDLQDLLELTSKKDVIFFIGDWNAKVGSQKHLEEQANLALEYRMKQGKG